MSGLFKRNPTSPIHEDVPLATNIKEPRESIFTSLQDPTRAARLTKYVRGSNWTVNYYSQITNTFSSLDKFDPDQANLSQPYTEIKALVIKAQGGLSHGDAEEGADGSLSGTAITPLDIIPKVGDVFIARIDSGEDALFTVVDVRRLDSKKNALYEIDYGIYFYTNERPDYVEKLYSRIQDSYVYDDSIDIRIGNRLVLQSDMDLKKQLDRFLLESHDFYMNQYVHPSVRTFAVPGTQGIYVDPVLVAFITKTNEIGGYRTKHIHRYTIPSEDYLRSTIFDSMLRRQLPVQTIINTQAGFFRGRDFWRRAALESFQFSGVEFMLHPINQHRGHASGQFYATIGTLGAPAVDITKVSLSYSNDVTVEVMSKDGPMVKKLLPELFVDDFYIVSPQFYTYIEDNDLGVDISEFEYVLFKYLNREKLNLDELFKIAETWGQWSDLHRFYLLPVLWLMIKVTLGRT